jgi:hypothetical protein
VTGSDPTAALWAAVIGIGVYHGINPGMGWPLAVSAGLIGRSRWALFTALGPLAFGHFLAMAGMLMPFGVMSALVIWERQIRLAAGLILIVAGLYLLIDQRHPRFIARIPPTRLAFWSFAVAIAHGAALMLVPIYLGLCRPEESDAGHQAAASLMATNFATAIAVAVVHTLAMIVSGGVTAFVVYEWLGLSFISKSWFNLDAVWASSLILVGLISIASTIAAV